MRPYEKNALDDIDLRWTRKFLAEERPVSSYWVELAAICDDFPIDLTALLRDYEATRATLRIKFRPRDVATLVWDLSEENAKRQLIELVGVSRKLAALSEVLMDIAIRRAGKARRATAIKGAQGRLAADPKQITMRAARELWPEANRRGWTAVQFHTELVRQGHIVAPDTSRKWLTALRKTGTC
jgi:hypothetical protein